MNKGTEYEIFFQEVTQTLLNRSDITNQSIRHNIKITGTCLTHQIDIYFEFEFLNTNYKVIVQTKDWNKPIDQEKILAFKAIIDDMPDKTQGIFVTRKGYQRGAKQYAKAKGIELLVLDEIKMEPISLPLYGKVIAKLIATPLTIIGEGEDVSLGLEYWVFEPKIQKTIHIDERWFQNELSILNKADHPKLEDCKIEKTPTKDINFYDGKEIILTNLDAIIKSQIAPVIENPGNHTLRHSFQIPTFVKTDNNILPLLKVETIVFNIEIKKSIRKIANGRDSKIKQFFLNFIDSGKRKILGKRIEN